MEACDGTGAKAPREQSSCCNPHNYLHTKVLGKLAVAAEPSRPNTSGAPAHILRHRQSQQHARTRQQPLQQQGIDTEAGMLSGISRKRSIRSRPYWFTEFCNSQCLSHFAAPFIVDRTETSIAESCKLLVAGAIGNPQRQHACKEALAAGTKRNRQSDGPIRPTTHEHLHKGPHKGKSSHTSSQEDAGEYVWNMCE